MKLNKYGKAIFIGTGVGAITFAIPALLGTFVPFEERVWIVAYGTIAALIGGLGVYVLFRNWHAIEWAIWWAIVLGPLLGFVALGFYVRGPRVATVPEYVPSYLFVLLFQVGLNLAGSLTIILGGWILGRIRRRK